jgi:hypothetical protein
VVKFPSVENQSCSICSQSYSQQIEVMLRELENGCLCEENVCPPTAVAQGDVTGGCGVT